MIILSLSTSILSIFNESFNVLLEDSKNFISIILQKLANSNGFIDFNSWQSQKYGYT